MYFISKNIFNINRTIKNINFIFLIKKLKFLKYTINDIIIEKQESYLFSYLFTTNEIYRRSEVDWSVMQARLFIKK